MTTRLRGPLLYANEGHPFNDLPLGVVDQIGPRGVTGYTHYFNHFHQWEGPVAEGAAGGWLLSGATGVATVVLGDVRIGTIVLTADVTAGSSPTLALGAAATGMNFAYVVGKRLDFFARVKLLTVATTELFLGVGTADAAPTVTGTFPSDGIFFDKASTATKVDTHVRKDGTSTEATLQSTTLLNDTYTVLGFRVFPSGVVKFYQDGVVITTVAAGAANLPASTDPMQLMLGILGASMSMTIDWVFIGADL